MSKLLIEGPADEVGSFWTQFYSRPVGFGFFNTFYPEPSGLTKNKSAVWRRRHWGEVADPNVQAMVNNNDAGDIELFSLVNTNALGRIAGLFPRSRFTWSITEIVPVSTGLLRKPPTLPDIFDIRWHRCRYCGIQLTKHVRLQCLFSSTEFTPVLSRWRTVYGEYVWQPSSMSFVSTSGTTATGCTIAARTLDQSPAKPMRPKRKRKSTAKPET